MPGIDQPGAGRRGHGRFSTRLGLLFFVLFPWMVHAAEAPSPGGLHERAVPMIGDGKQRLTLLLKLPPQARSGADIAGVFAFCTWEADPGKIRVMLDGKQGSGPGAQIVRFAAERNLAVLSWTTFDASETFDKTRSFDEMSRGEVAEFDRAFNKVARTWRRGVDELVRDHKLPSANWLLYGMSRGGQWAHRIALREPALFSAVHIHVNSSYDEPVPEAARIRWLVTTGELEAGFPAAKRFYAAAVAQKYPMIFHAEPNLGHDNHPNIDRLSMAFFDYIVSGLRSAATGRVPEVSERFAGNYFTHEYVPWSQVAQIPEKFRVPLPSRAIAEAWGLPVEEP